MDEHYHHFEDEEENKFIYTDIFNLYVSNCIISSIVSTTICTMCTCRQVILLQAMLSHVHVLCITHTHTHTHTYGWMVLYSLITISYWVNSALVATAVSLL